MKKYLIVTFLLHSACAGRVDSPGPEVAPRLLYPYESSEMCRGCHSEIYEQYRESMHAKSFSNPLFTAQYFKEVVPMAQHNAKFITYARKCLMCHAPVVYMNYTGLVSTPLQAERFESGVSCDFCHTLSGYTENGDYLQNPSGKKQGPIKSAANITSPEPSQHFEYSGFLPMAEYCGRCHNATNHNGLEVTSTYSEWRGSSYGERGITCQECHMNKNGLLKNGVAEFDSGVAAHLNIGFTAIEQKIHDKLYTHAFPGAHSIRQLEEALHIDFRIGVRTVDSQGRVPFIIVINNERSGHKMPSGSSDLRFMWLTVTATAEDKSRLPIVLLPAPIKEVADYSVAGAAPDDAFILGDDVPPGSRLYRSVFVNALGKQALFHYDAVKNIFDNRLKAAEVRNESYLIKLPPGFSGRITLSATLTYQAAPRSFTRRIQIEDFKPVVVASKMKKITLVTPPHAAERP